MFKPVYILYAIMLYIAIVSAKKNKKLTISLVASIFALNLVNLEFITTNFATKFLPIFIAEVVSIFISYIALLLTYNFSKMEMDKLSFIVEVLVSIGLILMYAYVGSILVNII